MRRGGTSQSLSGKPTSRAAFLINRPPTVLALVLPSQFLLSFAGSSQCREPRRLTTQCSWLNLQWGSLEISGVFALLRRAPRNEDFAAQLVAQGRVCGASLWRHFLCAGCLCESLVAARAWQVALHRALPSPKQPLSSSVELGCHPPPPLLPRPPGETPLMAPGDGCRYSASAKKPHTV